MKSLLEINKLEIEENWESAINSLEEIITSDPLDKRSILRLAFLYWYLFTGQGYIEHNVELNSLEYKLKMLFRNTFEIFNNDPEYLWVMGYMIKFYERSFDNWNNNSLLEDESFGFKLMKKAKSLSIEKPYNYSENNDGLLGKYFSSVIYQIYD